MGSSCGHDNLSRAAVVHHIFTTERDYVLCQSLQRAAQSELQCVVGVVGSAHVPGIVRFWNTEAACSAAPPHQTQSRGMELNDTMSNQGVKRALLERFLELSSSSAVCADMQHQLPPLPSEAMQAYAFTHELYGSPRMLLAFLPREHLQKVSVFNRCQRCTLSITAAHSI